jgi:hypothetical protein
MSEIANTNRNPLSLPADFANKLVSGIAESRATTIIAGGGKPLLRMLKSGDWVYGQANDEVQDGSLWAINIMSLAHGYCCWVEGAGSSKNELRGEVMISMTEPKPQRPPPIDGSPYAEQRAFEAKCMTGEDTGVEVLHKTASVGGLRAVDQLLEEIQVKLQNPDGVQYPYPVVELQHDHYEHSKWGRIYTPVFTIVNWADLDGNLERQDRRVAKATAREEEQPQPVSTQRAHAGQRRRPSVR